MTEPRTHIVSRENVHTFQLRQYTTLDSGTGLSSSIRRYPTLRCRSETFVGLGGFAVGWRRLGRVLAPHRRHGMPRDSDRPFLGLRRSELPSFLQIGCELVYPPPCSCYVHLVDPDVPQFTKGRNMGGYIDATSFFLNGTWVDPQSGQSH